MYPKYHIILGLIFSLAIYSLFPQIELLGFFIIFLSTFLIDIDHYLYTAFKQKKSNPISVTKWHFAMARKSNKMTLKERKKYYSAWAFLHGFDIIFVLLILSFVSKYFLYIATGFTFHLLLDVIHESKHLKRADKLSSVYDYIKFKKLKLINKGN